MNVFKNTFLILLKGSPTCNSVRMVATPSNLELSVGSKDTAICQELLNMWYDIFPTCQFFCWSSTILEDLFPLSCEVSNVVLHQTLKSVHSQQGPGHVTKPRSITITRKSSSFQVTTGWTPFAAHFVCVYITRFSRSRRFDPLPLLIINPL